MQKDIIKLQFTTENEEVIKKIQKVWKSRIPMRDFIETLFLQADIGYYKKTLGI